MKNSQLQTGLALNRRELLVAAAFGAASTTSETSAAANMPTQAHLLIKNASVLTMDPAIPDLPRGDIHVRDGIIVAVGVDISVPGAAIIDGSNMIALPGLVDTHNHLWNTACRNFVREGPKDGYFDVVYALGQVYAPDDIYACVRLGCAEMISAGITCVNDWAHNVRSPEHARADLRALAECGIRARFSYGHYHGGPAPELPMDMTDLAILQANWPSFSNDGLLSLGWAARVFVPTGLASVHPMTLEVARKDWASVRSLKLPITAHISGGMQFLEREGFLGPDLQITGTRGLDGEDFSIVAKTGTHVSTTPHSEMRYSYSFPKIPELLKLGVKVSLACDTAPVSGSNDLFAAMRLAMDTQFVRLKDPMSITARQVLEMATINGAWDMGIADRVGSLTPGKRADLIMIRTNDLNMAPLGDPVTAVVRSAQPHNVDTVIIDGRILKRNGRLTALDPVEIVAKAIDSLKAVRERAGRR